MLSVQISTNKIVHVFWTDSNTTTNKYKEFIYKYKTGPGTRKVFSNQKHNKKQHPFFRLEKVQRKDVHLFEASLDIMGDQLRVP